MATPFACTAPDATRKTLLDSGYRDVTVGDYRWWACGHDDDFATSFTATNSTGQHVSGVVCCGWLVKGCTVRF